MLKWVRLPQSEPEPPTPEASTDDVYEYTARGSGTIVDGSVFRQQGFQRRHNGALWFRSRVRKGTDMNFFLVREEARDGSFGWVIGNNDIYGSKPTVLFGAVCVKQRKIPRDGKIDDNEILPPLAGWHMFPSYSYALSTEEIQPKPSSLMLDLRLSSNTPKSHRIAGPLL